jgi:hypothetical protein
MRMNVDEVDRPRTGCRQDAEVFAFGVMGTESAQRVRRRMISARNGRLCAEPRFDESWESCIARLRCDGPGTDFWRSEVAELPNCIIIEVPTRRVETG